MGVILHVQIYCLLCLMVFSTIFKVDIGQFRPKDSVLYVAKRLKNNPVVWCLVLSFFLFWMLLVFGDFDGSRVLIYGTYFSLLSMIVWSAILSRRFYCLSFLVYCNLFSLFIIFLDIKSKIFINSFIMTSVVLAMLVVKYRKRY